MALSFMLPALDVRPGELSAAERAVLVTLAEDARSGVGMASPGHERLMSVSGLKSRQVSNVLRKLAEMGLIVLHRAARTGQRAVYKLLIAERIRDSQDASQCRQTRATGSNGGTSSTHHSAGLPGGSLPGKTPGARARDVASKIKEKVKGSKVDYSATPWRAPAVLPDNPLKPTPRPDRAALPEPPAWALERAREQLDSRFASPVAVAALARSIAAERVTLSPIN